MPLFQLRLNVSSNLLLGLLPLLLHFLDFQQTVKTGKSSFTEASNGELVWLDLNLLARSFCSVLSCVLQKCEDGVE